VRGVHVDQPFSAVPRGEVLAPYRTLALRVISLAVHDLVAPRALASERDTARAFLSGSSMLTHWCKLADIDPETIRQQMRGAVGGSFTTHSLRRH
jgi:hypothetical protein